MQEYYPRAMSEVTEIGDAKKWNTSWSRIAYPMQPTEINQVLLLKTPIDLIHRPAHSLALGIIKKSKSVEMVRNQIEKPHTNMHRSIVWAILPKVRESGLAGSLCHGSQKYFCGHSSRKALRRSRVLEIDE